MSSITEVATIGNGVGVMRNEIVVIVVIANLAVGLLGI